MPIIIAEEENDTEDVVYRAFQKGKFFTANNNLTSYFQNHFLLSQGNFWTEFTLPPKWIQQVMSCMLGKLLTLGSLLRITRTTKDIVRHVTNMLPHETSTLSSKTVNKSTSSLSSQRLLHGSNKATTARDFKSSLQLSLKRYWSSARPSTWLENPVPSKL